MLELIDPIWCKIIILMNHLPVYKIIFFTYFLLPVVGISYYYFRNFQSNPLFLSFVLLCIWIIQLITWMKYHAKYYNI